MKKIVRCQRLLAFLLTFALTAGALCISASAWTGNGIANNGFGGISINIYDAPYTTYANKSYGQYAYGPSGCAWFASARACQLTGKDTPIWAGSSWYEFAYSYYGYSRVSQPMAKSLVCYSGHVAVIEAVNGDTITISEGGNTSYGGNDYCVIRTRTRAQVESGGFLGYVYLGVGNSSNNPSNIVTFGNFYGYVYSPYANMVLTTNTTGSWGNVYMAPYTGAKRQLWRFNEDESGYYTIYSVYDGTCLDVGNASTADGANLTTNVPSGHNAQKFYFTKSGDAYVMHTKLCGTVVDIPGDTGPYNGINVQMWSPWGGTNQQFVLYEVIAPYPGLCAYGDVDMNTVVNATDALLVLRHAVGKAPLPTVYHENTDVSIDGKIDAADALLILKKAVGKLAKFPCEP